MTTATRFTFDPATDFILDRLGFVPTGKEQAAIIRSRKQFKLVVGGEQAGKSLTAVTDFFVHLAEDMASRPGEPLLYWLVAMDYPRTTAEFNYIKEGLLKLSCKITDESKRVDPGHIECNYPGNPPIKIRIETKSGKDPRTLSMFAPNGIIGCEASQLDLDTYQKCIARITPKNGWLHLAGTFEGSLGWYPSLAKAWEYGGKDEQSFRLPSPTNYHFYPGGLDDPKLARLRAETSDQFFNERIMGIAAPPRGIVFDTFRPDIHFRDLEYNPDLPVHISVDPGFNHAYAIECWQPTPTGQVRVFDEIYERGITTQDLINVLVKRPWWKNSDKTLVIDPNYANQHQGQRSMAEIWQEKAQLPVFGTKFSVMDGVDRFKTFLKVDAVTGEPGIIFNGKLRPDRDGKMRPTCEGVGSELGAFTNPFDDQTHVYVYKQDSQGNLIEPEQRWNDGLSAMMYGIVNWAGLVTTDSSATYTMTSLRPPRQGRMARRQIGAYR